MRDSHVAFPVSREPLAVCVPRVRCASEPAGLQRAAAMGIPIRAEYTAARDTSRAHAGAYHHAAIREGQGHAYPLAYHRPKPTPRVRYRCRLTHVDMAGAIVMVLRRPIWCRS